MNPKAVLQLVEQTLLHRQLSSIEQKVLVQAWKGKAYNSMSHEIGYTAVYLKEVGAQLWQELSEVLGQRVTKKNLSIVLDQCSQETTQAQSEHQQSQEHSSRSNFSQTTNISFPGAPLAANSPYYISRPPVEELVCRGIVELGCLLRIKAPRRMGKSSLLNQLIAHVINLGYKKVYMDFQDADASIFASLDETLRWFCANICQQLDIPPNFDSYWSQIVGSKMSCKMFFAGYLLESIQTPIVLIINEVNRVFEHPEIAQDFLPLIRSFHEQSHNDEAWHKLRFVLAYSTDVYVPLKLNQSPFNVGLSLKLTSFTVEQVKDLAGRYGLNWQQGNEAEQLMTMVGGHPYLINVALYFLSQRTIHLAQLLKTAPTPSGIYGQHLQGYLVLLQDDPSLLFALQRVVQSQKSIKLDTIAAYKLESLGLVELEGFYAKPSCDLYRLYFCGILTQEEA